MIYKSNPTTELSQQRAQITERELDKKRAERIASSEQREQKNDQKEAQRKSNTAKNLQITTSAIDSVGTACALIPVAGQFIAAGCAIVATVMGSVAADKASKAKQAANEAAQHGANAEQAQIEATQLNQELSADKAKEQELEGITKIANEKKNADKLPQSTINQQSLEGEVTAESSYETLSKNPQEQQTTTI